MGFEGARSEIILRHFDGNHDELMEALICGYEVEQTPEEKVRQYYRKLIESDPEEFTQGALAGFIDALDLLRIKIDGVNA